MRKYEQDLLNQVKSTIEEITNGREVEQRRTALFAAGDEAGKYLHPPTDADKVRMLADAQEAGIKLAEVGAWLAAQVAWLEGEEEA